MTDIFYVLHKESCRPSGCMFFDDRVYTESLHQPVELMGIQTSCFRGSTWPGKVTIFHTFCKKQKTISFPDEPFYLAGTSATEKKKSVWYKDREMILSFNNGSKAVDTKAHVSASTDEVDSVKLFWVGISKHGVPPG